MILDRVEDTTNISETVDKIVFWVDGNKYTLTESHNRINVHAHEGGIRIQPGCKNEIYLWSED